MDTFAMNTASMRKNNEASNNQLNEAIKIFKNCYPTDEAKKIE